MSPDTPPPLLAIGTGNGSQFSTVERSRLPGQTAFSVYKFTLVTSRLRQELFISKCFALNKKPLESGGFWVGNLSNDFDWNCVAGDLDYVGLAQNLLILYPDLGDLRTVAGGVRLSGIYNIGVVVPFDRRNAATPMNN